MDILFFFSPNILPFIYASSLSKRFPKYKYFIHEDPQILQGTAEQERAAGLFTQIIHQQLNAGGIMSLKGLHR